MPCIQREVLLGHFAAAAAAYTTAVVRMKELNGLEFRQAWDDAETLFARFTGEQTASDRQFRLRSQYGTVR